ncbi:hypothetical protein GCM10010264_53730 [Streptomyces globisporus]|nr:hypothetical protein GCM10010264_53730 [Streptomyces globisporus]
MGPRLPRLAPDGDSAMTARRRGCGIRVTDSRADARRGDFPSPNGQGDLSRIPQGRQATKPPKGAKQTKQAKAQDPDEISFVGVLFAAVVARWRPCSAGGVSR